MQLFQRMFFAAVLAGLAAGLLMTAIQQWRVVPLIVAAEQFEGVPAHEHAPGAPAHHHVVSADAAAPWAPQDGAERIAYTVLADVLVCIGFALVLGAAAVLSGLPLTARNGVIWGLAGFLTFQLAPAIGLPPELPGMAAAEVSARQLWWWGTALATAAAIFGIAKFRSWPAIGLGAVLILLPHVIGAPPAPEQPSAVPAHLATAFAANALAAGAVFWLAVGPLLGWLGARFAAVPAAAATNGVHA